MKAKLDQQYWTNRYHNHETAWDAGRITTPLKDYFDTLPVMAREKQVDRVELFARVYAPTTCTASSVAALGSFLKTHQDLPPVVYKELQVAHQEDGKCVAARAK